MTLELLCYCPERWTMGAQGTDVVAFVRLIAFAGRHLNFFCRHCAIWITFLPCCRFFSISRNSKLFDPATRRLTAKCLSHLQLASSLHWSYASRPKAPPPRSEYWVVDASFLSMGYGNPAHAHERDLVVACYVSDPRLQTRISSSMTNIAHNKRRQSTKQHHIWAMPCRSPTLCHAICNVALAPSFTSTYALCLRLDKPHHSGIEHTFLEVYPLHACR